jgi:orotidine-5'-phosphate decarboxylase
LDGLNSSPLIIALDHETVADAEACIGSMAGLVERYKVGSVLYSRVGPPFVRELIDAGYSVFLDLKFHDTPATVAGAVAAAADLGVDLVTLHAAGGIEMLESARRAVDVGDSGLRLLAVTVLTSLDEEDYQRMVGPGARSLGEAVTALAEMAIDSGIDGCVCAASDAARLRTALGPAPLLVVPGIRPAWSIANHSGQVRTATPRAAMDAGASYIVVGRAVTGAQDPAAAVVRIHAELAA